MSIKLKIILIIIPLFVFVLILTSTISALTTRSGLIRFGVESFAFKSNQFEQYIDEQWELLEENGLTEDESFILTFIDSLDSEASSLLSNPAEVIFAFKPPKNDKELEVVFTTTDNATSDAEANTEEIKIEELQELYAELADAVISTTDDGIEVISASRSWLAHSFDLLNKPYVGYYFTVPIQEMVVVVAMTEKAFLQPVRKIILITLLVILIAVAVSIVIIILFSNSLVNPLKSMLKSMHHIIESNSFDDRVEVLYQDEIGQLSQTFNVMVSELDKAYRQIKEYAFSAVLAKKNESKIRNIFQKYVPVNVINSLFQDPSRLLEGENRQLSLLFTDIRSFTTISETYKPDELVKVLNTYFEKLVDIITENNGIIDKYIGDAIMAFFGAPVEIDNSPLAAVTSAVHIIEVLDEFNAGLRKKKLPEFITGLGINYGLVTVGNIGSDKKMDYTAIGDAVNLGSRLEGLTKGYKQDLIFSTSVRDNVHDQFPCRLVDIVQVKGKTVGEKIYTTTPYLNDKVLQAYGIHNTAVDLYLKRDFKKAKAQFSEVLKILPKDFLAKLFIDRCSEFIASPPDNSWNGVAIMTTK